MGAAHAAAATAATIAMPGWLRRRRCIAQVSQPWAALPTDGLLDLPDDPLRRDRPPVAAVVGRTAVVAQGEPVVGGDRDRPGEVAVVAGVARADERLVLLLAVDDRVAVHDRDGVAGARNDALDEVDVGLRR